MNIMYRVIFITDRRVVYTMTTMISLDSQKKTGVRDKRVGDPISSTV